MNIIFYKYHSNGNDFILIDDRKIHLTKKKKIEKIFKKMCERNFCIGADGLILIQNYKYNNFFYIKYYNSDGKEGTMCGNGSRCAVAFLKKLNIINNFFFKTKDGIHNFYIKKNIISLQMKDILISNILIKKKNCILNTGSPHYIIFLSNIEKLNVFNIGKKIRFKKKYFKLGINVNFVEIKKNYLKIRTYERGVENETLSCGTGTTAAVISAFQIKKIFNKKIYVISPGGELLVNFDKKINKYKNIWITGIVNFIYKGYFNI